MLFRSVLYTLIYNHVCICICIHTLVDLMISWGNPKFYITIIDSMDVYTGHVPRPVPQEEGEPRQVLQGPQPVAARPDINNIIYGCMHTHIVTLGHIYTCVILLCIRPPHPQSQPWRRRSSAGRARRPGRRSVCACARARARTCPCVCACACVRKCVSA